MGRFDSITPSDITIWINPVAQSIMGSVWVDGDFHEVIFPKGRLNMQMILDSLKEDLPVRAKLAEGERERGENE